MLESRLEFLEADATENLQKVNPRAHLNILTGFETLDHDIRTRVLGKGDTVESFCTKLRLVQSLGLGLTAYVLFKSHPEMSDRAALIEAESSIDFLIAQCRDLRIPLTIRLNPMYIASGTRLAEEVDRGAYLPPRLTDVLRLAKKKRAEGASIYLGLSSEDLDEPASTYQSRNDFTSDLLREAIAFNQGHIRSR